MTAADTKKDAILPWEKSKDREGYGKLDLHVDLGEHGTLSVKRQRPNEAEPGKFSVYLRDEMISPHAYFMRPEAVAAAERMIYSSDQFRNAKPATMINATVQMGRDSFMAGSAVWACPIGADKPVSREHWLTGWLEAYANTVIAPLKEGITQTTRAYNQLASDADHLQSRVAAFQTILAFANGMDDPERLQTFIKLANAGDLDAIRAEFPGLLPVPKEPTEPGA